MNVLVITGHPDPQSFCSALSHAYMEAAASEKGANVRELDLSRMSFEPNLKYGYRKRMELEEDLLKAQELIRWADHLVFVYPIWWGTMPAVLKGFFDRVFLPGFAYKYRDNSPLWDKLLKGKTAHLLVTMDTPPWYNRWIYRRAGHRVMKRNILGFCGIKTVRITEFSPVSSSTEAMRAKWLEKSRKLGASLA
ncbi:MAG: NAD(P)H-dependent oxidoreductase [Paenibacillus macerans]|uniref:Flavodoxin family protein n=1 Tax=Paenibacillus macerans TaxID=44252 RepID=A0A090YCL5_PAEMA|nr:NAD(P)H-dependent oxidoreductase [Paenibacillus macerans]KFM95936.1 NADPH-dependent FMN reductase family protein [Paenibacillus macerans]MBS5914197.1 NAD(P)H-dependent oxidoreductase [Paenibacillus macerans]MCY7558776.1 NAD(P)H-dependent oxidoreductase [Paenibacillus macerans]MDU7474274.1 NAD(P)H-dependent oxidoreductase [Paenibacillus macerans]MEC0149792.1 NAD(P)H-dependent oxidoreductase [Paenibacillus macerans]